jgi:hypothetical protein
MIYTRVAKDRWRNFDNPLEKLGVTPPIEPTTPGGKFALSSQATATEVDHECPPVPSIDKAPADVSKQMNHAITTTNIEKDSELMSESDLTQSIKLLIRWFQDRWSAS